ncbi:glucuronate isomerase [Desulfitibacter alkalitolerans]|uniref:glucuronate isomerase n=1 Tax=Desulfitibacter alkalitolerans TaxID=264641 RepID=UPI00048026CB|nr:glucuronate isomerase [Desulfitibacter alkalitolerans]
MRITDLSQLRNILNKEISEIKVTDIHTHIYSADFKGLFLWGIDELLTYHYVLAEYFRVSDMDYGRFFKLSKEEQANLIWQELFVNRSPISEAQRGVITVLDKLGLDVSSKDIDYLRAYFKSMNINEYLTRVFDLAGVRCVVMTNDPFDKEEASIWNKTGNSDSRFKAALRIDPLLNNYQETYKDLKGMGYNVELDLSTESLEEIKRFLFEWATKIQALYMAVSLPPDFIMEDKSTRTHIIKKCVMPVCAELNIPMALMIGVKRGVNSKLELAADSLGKASIKPVEYLCKNYPKNKFMVTMLSRENQHELAVTARKFRNLMVFGCWWFTNIPSIVEEITKMRIELLGASFIPQHSDVRVLEQLIYKWEHSRQIIANVLLEKYSYLVKSNWEVTEEDIKRDIDALFNKNFWDFIDAKFTA